MPHANLETTEELLRNIKLSLKELSNWLQERNPRPVDRESLAYIMWAARQFYRDNKTTDSKF